MSFGGTIKLTGESDYRRALKQITTDLRTMSTALKSQTADFNASDKSITSTAAKQRELTRTISDQRTAVSNAQRAYSQYSVALQAQSARHNALNREYKSAVVELDRIRQTSGEASEEYRKQAEVVARLEGELVESTDEMDKSKRAMAALKSEINTANKTINAAEREMDELGSETKETGEQAEKAKEGFTVFKGALANLVAQGIRTAINGLKELAKQTIEVGASFEAAMSQVEAVSGATGEELEQLTAKAEEMGAKTKFSASESAEAFNYMAMAGWKTEDMLGGIEGVMNLAAASGEDLATTSDIVTDALTAMGYSAKDAGRLADVMAAASSNANTNVAMMGQTFQYAAPIVGALGYNMEDTAVQIGLMANAGIKGEKAGTALSSILTRLSAPPKECADAMEKLGISMTDSSGKMKSLDSVMGELRTAFSKMSETEQTATAKHIAGAEAMSGLLAIVNAAPADYDKLKKAVDGSNGAAQRMADTMNDNVQGAMTIFKSQVEGVQISLFKKLEPALRSAIKAASDMVSKVDWNAFGDKAKKALDKLMDGLKWVIDNHQKIITAMKLVIGAFAVAKILSFTKSLSDMAKGFIEIAKGTALATAAANTNTAAEVANTGAKVAATGATGALTTATNLLNAAWAANPVGVVVAGITALVGVIGLAAKATNNMTEEEKAQQEALEATREEINRNAEAWKELEEAQQQQINAGMTEVSHLETLWDELQGIVDQNGKVKKGYEERANFITSRLSEATGVEIKNVDGVIQKYGTLKQTIDEVMEKKKAQIILDSQESLYKEAIEKQDAALKNLQKTQENYLSKKEELTNLEVKLEETKDLEINEANNNYILRIKKMISAKKDEVNELEKDYKKQEDLYGSYAYNIGQYEQNMALFHAGKYDEMTQVNWDYVKEYQGADDAEKKLLEDKISTTQRKLSELEKLRDGSNSKIYDSQIAAAKKELSQLESQMKQYNSATKKGTKQTEIIWSDSLGEQLSEITGHKIKFKNAGKGNVQMVVDGQKVGAPKSKKEMAKMTTDAIKEITKKDKDAKKAGEELIDGVNKGVKNQDKQSGVFSSIASFGSKLLGKLKAALKEKSPSKATEEMGGFLLDGLKIGMEAKEASTLKQAAGFGKSLLGALSGEFSQGVKLGKLNLNANVPNYTATQTPAERNANSFDNIVSAFKVALSEMKIELDDEVAGEFVEKTVTRVVYS